MEESNEVPTLTQNDPIRMPGQIRLPKRITPPNAIPEAGHTAVAYPGGIASSNPSLPAR